MLTAFFDKAFFLQAIGWAIAHSIWQAALLWLVYNAVVKTNKNLPALVKYQLSMLLIFLSLFWFGFTAFNYYTGSHQGLPFLLQQLQAPLAFITQGLPYLGILYFTMLSVYIYRFVRQYNQLTIAGTSNLIKAPVDVRIFTADTALHLGIKRKVQVWMSNRVNVPSVTGFIKPVILLPIAVVNHLTVDQLNAVLLHELAHIKRNDFLLNLLQTLASVLLFFNPFVGLLNAVANKERENSCDDWVINFRYNQKEYASALLVLEEQRDSELALALAATNNEKLLLHRIKRLFDARETSVSATLMQRFQLYGLAVLLLAIIFLQPAAVLKQMDTVKANLRIVNPSYNLTKEVFPGNKYAMTEHPQIMESIVKPGKHMAPKYSPTAKPVLKKQAPASKLEDDFVLALVSEDAISGKLELPHATFTMVSKKEKDSTQSAVVIKIEEEQSGTRQRNTYYFKLKNENGETDIKPLLFLKKYKATKQAAAKKETAHKKRVTT